MTCVYVNPSLDQFWLIDYRLYDSAGDGNSKLNHVHEMLSNLVYHKQLSFQAVLMDTWYATKEPMRFIESVQEIYYCPLKDNRQVDDFGGQRPYCRVDSLHWNAVELIHGKWIKIKVFPKDHKVCLFRVEVSTHRMGLGCNQRFHSGLDQGYPKGVWLSLQNRAIAPRRQAAHGARTLPMS